MVGTQRTWLPEQVGCRKGGAYLWSGLWGGLYMLHQGLLAVPRVVGGYLGGGRGLQISLCPCFGSGVEGAWVQAWGWGLASVFHGVFWVFVVAFVAKPTKTVGLKKAADCCVLVRDAFGMGP